MISAARSAGIAVPSIIWRISALSALIASRQHLRPVIVELAASELTERGATRADDRVSEAAMEDRKREGYF